MDIGGDVRTRDVCGVGVVSIDWGDLDGTRMLSFGEGEEVFNDV